MDQKFKHLELIQGVINRLSTNSFLLKGWSVVLVSALFALAAPESRAAFVYLAYIPAIVFWGLDGYFLWQERLYRALYDHVRSKPDAEIEFSMDTSSCRSGSASGWPGAVLSRTLLTKIQSIKADARGFRRFENYRYRHCGKLDLRPIIS